MAKIVKYFLLQLAHYPSGVPGYRGIEREDFPAPPFPFSDQERKRRRSGSIGSNQEQVEEEKPEEVDPATEEKLRYERVYLLFSIKYNFQET